MTSMDLQKEQIIHHIADEIKKNIKQTISSKTDIDWGLYTGLLGMIIFLFYYARWTNKKNDIQIANSFLEYYISNVPLAEIHYSYCSGLSGILVGINHLNKHRFAEISTSLIMPFLSDYMLQIVKSDNANFDFMHGTIGLGIMLRYYDLNAIQKELLSQLANHIVVDTNLKWLTFKDFNTNQFVENISLSHGMSSVISYLSMLSSIDKNFKQEVKSNLNCFVNYILSQKYLNYQDIGSFFPYTSLKDQVCKSRLAWCYGDLEISIALFNAGLLTNEENWKKEAIKVLSFSTNRLNTIDNGVVDACFCHGTAGISQIYNRLYIMTKIQQFKNASEYWVNETLKYSKFPDGLVGYKTAFGNSLFNEYNLLEGIAGIGLSLLASLDRARLSSWDSLFLLSVD